MIVRISVRYLHSGQRFMLSYVTFTTRNVRYLPSGLVMVEVENNPFGVHALVFHPETLVDTHE